jgi:hypothetical protein
MFSESFIIADIPKLPKPSIHCYTEFFENGALYLNSSVPKQYVSN